MTRGILGQGEGPQRARFSLPKPPVIIRKAIQLGSPHGQGPAPAWVKRRADAAAGNAPQQVMLTMDKVQAAILDWNYYEVVKGGVAHMQMMKPVPKTFSSAAMYAETFKSLLLEELRASAQQVYEEDSRASRSARQKPGSLVGVAMKLQSQQRLSTLFQLELTMDKIEGPGFRMDDLLLLVRPEGDPLQQDPGPHCLLLVNQLEDTPGIHGQTTLHASASFSGNAPGRQADEALRRLLPGTTWHATRVMSCTPHLRQFQALCKLGSLPTQHLQHILQPRATGPSLKPHNLASALVSNSLKASLEQHYNESQQRAICACLSASEPFTLIQGPPGTGKTAAIIGIISALLLARRPVATANGKSSASEAALDAEYAQNKRSRLSKKDTGNPLKLTGEAPPVRVLVCAQSNAAVDELVERLGTQGLFAVSSNGKARRIPAMVRMGKMESATSTAQWFQIDAVAAANDEHVGEAQGSYTAARRRVREIRQEMDTLHEKMRAMEAATQASDQPVAEEQGEDGAGLSGTSSTDVAAGEDTCKSAARKAARPSSKVQAEKLAGLKARKKELHGQLNANRVSAKAGPEEVAKAKRAVRQAIVDHAEIVACTLSAAGGDLLNLTHTGRRFDAVLTDEAAQALEPAALIPLQMLAANGGKVVLVGDPKQLPATVLSRAAQAKLLSQSLFERLQQAGHGVVMLSEQYRMHPAISMWPSLFFYERKLLDGPELRDGSCRRAPWHSRPCFPPLAFFDCQEGRERSGAGAGGSLSNSTEAELAAKLLAGLLKRHGEDVREVALLTPYRAQLGILRRAAQRELDEKALLTVTFATVDGFQGKEADVVIFSCVRASGEASKIGFLADVRRMNVGLTRARRSLWVIGHRKTLLSCAPWASFLKDCQKRKALFSAASPFSGLLHAPLSQLLASSPGSEDGVLTKRPRDVEPASEGSKRSRTLDKRSNADASQHRRRAAGSYE
ncbi:hypothetical protein WJX84_007623 [Apatococcus fuscideae]